MGAGLALSINLQINSEPIDPSVLFRWRLGLKSPGKQTPSGSEEALEEVGQCSNLSLVVPESLTAWETRKHEKTPG